MHKRQLWMLHVGLAAAAALLAWRLGTEWQQANQRYRAVSPAAERSAVPLSATTRRDPPPTEEIVAQNLFSPDRTSVIALPETSQQPPPAVPTVLGTLKLGPSYEALLAEPGEDPRHASRRVKQGEQFGGYTVVEILDEKVVVEYRGQQTTLDVYQSARRVARPAPRTVPASQPVVVETGGGASAPAPAARQPGAATRAPAAQPPPGTPPDVRVTVEGNRRRFERSTPFGTQTWYEPLEQ